MRSICVLSLSAPTTEKVRAISQFPKPKTVVELRRFLGKVNFYRIAIPHAAETHAPLNQYLLDSRENDKREIQWNVASEAAFEQVKKELANAALLAHPSHHAKTRLVTDASNYGMGASLEQLWDNVWKPLAFFSRKFSSAQLNYSAYDRELAAIYEAVRHFRYFLEGQDFTIVTDHEPLIHTFTQRAEKKSLRQQRQISYSSQFTTNISYVPGSKNVVADSLSRVETMRLPTEFSLIELAQTQSADEELKKLIEDPKCSLSFRKIFWGAEHTALYCDLTGEALRPYIPVPLRRRVFKLFHEPAHPGARVQHGFNMVQKLHTMSTIESIATQSRHSSAFQRHGEKVASHVKDRDYVPFQLWVVAFSFNCFARASL